MIMDGKIVSCAYCGMPMTHPTLKFRRTGDGMVCQACLNYDEMLKTDWDAREKELHQLCNKHRKDDGRYDVVCPVSGGKDSHYIVDTLVNEGMNPLLVTVNDPFRHTEAGTQNLNNLKTTYDLDSIVFEMGRQTFSKATSTAMIMRGHPLQFIEYAIYTFPVKVAMRFDIPFVMYGEDSAYLYGASPHERKLANPVVEGIFNEVEKDKRFWFEEAELQIYDMNSVMLHRNKGFLPEIHFMSYYSMWNNDKHVEIARKNGFKDIKHEWQRDGCIPEDDTQQDSYGYMIHLYMKYIKFMCGRVSDITSRKVRWGEMSLDEAKELVLKHDHKVDQQAVDAFCEALGWDLKNFWFWWDEWYNEDLFSKDKDGIWKPKVARF